MRLVTIDFETHYAQDYSLSKMTPLGYVMDPRFQFVSCSIKVDHHPTDVVFGEAKIRHAFKVIDPIVRDSLLLAHNMSGFDAYVCAYRLGVRPKLWGCTMAMARPIHAKTTGLGLAKLVAHYADELRAMGISPVKDNTALVQTRGKRLEDFTPAELEAMRTYNRTDTDQCYGLFHILRRFYTPAELWQIDAITRMRTEPQFELDRPLLEAALSVERSNKHKALIDLARDLRHDQQAGDADLDWSNEEDVARFVRSELASAPKFSAMLERLGAEVPMKPSPTNPTKQVPALAKTDEAFIALQESDDPLVAAAARARLSVKSTLLETRIDKFLTAGGLAGGMLPVPLRYAGADTTGRDSGEEYNCQALPRIDPDKPKTSDALRNSLRAPRGKKVIVADQSGIELRVNHFLWKVPSSMELYEASPAKADLYRAFAAESLFKVPPEQISKSQRQLGKMCLLEGTLVLTRRGEVPIEQVTASDQVWDGVEWVTTDGAVYMGVKDVIQHDGLVATSDHEVWVETGHKVPFGVAAAQSQRLARTGEAGSPLGFGGAGVLGNSADQRVQVRERAVHELRYGEVGVLHQPDPRQNEGVPELLSEMRGAAVATPTPGGGTSAMHESEGPRLPSLRGAGDSVSVPVGGLCGGVGDGQPGPGAGEGIGPHSQLGALRAGQPAVGVAQAECSQPGPQQIGAISSVPPPPPGGAVRGQHTAQPAGQGVFGGANSGALEPTVVQAQGRVWDLLNCGPRHRFTANGRLVSNCQLGLGFGAGAPTFQRVARTMGGLRLPLNRREYDGPELTAEEVVQIWRESYSPIVQGWKQCARGVLDIARGVEAAVDPWGLVHTCREGFVLPSGRIIRYPDLREEDDGEWPDGRPRRSWFYAHGRHKARITGPKADENIVQALARDSIFDCSVEFYRRTQLRPALRVHDELVYVVEERHGQELLDELQAIMRTPPKWWPGLVVWSEGDMAANYGTAK